MIPIDIGVFKNEIDNEIIVINLINITLMSTNILN